jgi:hypothetical protein
VPPEVKPEAIDEDSAAIIWPTIDVPAAPSADTSPPPSPPTLPADPPVWPEGSWTLDFPANAAQQSLARKKARVDERGVVVKKKKKKKKKEEVEGKGIGRKRKAGEMEEEKDEEEEAEYEMVDEEEMEEMVADESEEIEEREPMTPYGFTVSDAYCIGNADPSLGCFNVVS